MCECERVIIRDNRGIHFIKRAPCQCWCWSGPRGSRVGSRSLTRTVTVIKPPHTVNKATPTSKDVRRTPLNPYLSRTTRSTEGRAVEGLRYSHTHLTTLRRARAWRRRRGCGARPSASSPRGTAPSVAAASPAPGPRRRRPSAPHARRGSAGSCVRKGEVSSSSTPWWVGRAAGRCLRGERARRPTAGSGRSHAPSTRAARGARSHWEAAGAARQPSPPQASGPGLGRTCAPPRSLL